MDHDERMTINQSINKMFVLFSKLAKVDQHEKEIEEYLDEHHKVKEILSKLASNDYTPTNYS